MSTPIGRTRWAIAEGYIPSGSTGPEPAMTSHETACMLNTTDYDAQVEITIFFTDREPVGPYHVTVPARRTLPPALQRAEGAGPGPARTDYASLITSNVPIVVQHTRLDSRQAENALISTIAFAAAPDHGASPRPHWSGGG